MRIPPSELAALLLLSKARPIALCQDRTHAAIWWVLHFGSLSAPLTMAIEGPLRPIALPRALSRTSVGASLVNARPNAYCKPHAAFKDFDEGLEKELDALGRCSQLCCGPHVRLQPWHLRCQAHH